MTNVDAWAARQRIAPTAVRRAIAAGEVPVIRIRGRRVVTESALDTWLALHASGSQVQESTRRGHP